MKVFIKNKIALKLGLTLSIAVGITACGGSDSSNDTPPDNNSTGVIYVATNNPTDNNLIAYQRDDNGELTYLNNYTTEGRGIRFTDGPSVDGIDPLASSYSVLHSQDKHFVYAVNAGDDTVSTFKVEPDHSLTLLETVGTSGSVPNTLATDGKYLFVGEQNGDNNNATISTYEIAEDGTLGQALTFISPATLLSRISAMQVTPDGKTLVMVSAVSDEVRTLKIMEDGSLQPIDTYTYTPEPGRSAANPFAVTLIEDQGALLAVVSDVRGGLGATTRETGSLSLFEITSEQKITPIQVDFRLDDDGDDTKGPITPCWVAVNDQGYYVTGNTESNSLSTGKVTKDGFVLGQAEGYSAGPVNSIDDIVGLIDVIAIGNIFYQVYSSGRIASFSIDETGMLTEIDSETEGFMPDNNAGITGF